MIILKHNNEIIETSYSDYLVLKSELNIPFQIFKLDEIEELINYYFYLF